MSSSTSAGAGAKPTIEQIRIATKAVGSTLEAGSKYAVIGGAACAILGSNRETEAVDFVVPKGNIRSARQLLGSDSAHFRIEKRTLRTHFCTNPSVEIEILAPPALFREAFDASTPTLNVQGVEILKPSLLLNAKCRSIVERATEGKKFADAQDIEFLLRWLAETRTAVQREEVPDASQEFVSWIISNYHGEQRKGLWVNAGYNMVTGRSHFDQ